MHVRAQARRQPGDDDLDDPTQGVAVLVGGVDLGDHRGRPLGLEGAHRVGVERLDVVGGRQRGVVGHRGPADGDGVRHQADAVGLLQEPRGHLAEGHPGRGLAGRGALEHRARVVEGVLLHADQVGVARPRPGERPVAGDLLLGVDVVGRGERVGVDRVGAHHRLPLGPLRVADPDGDRRPQRQAVPHPAEELDLVLLELHPGAAAVAQPPARQGAGDVGRGDLDARGQAIDGRDERGPVRLPSGQPAQHGSNPSTRASATREPGQDPGCEGDADPGPEAHRRAVRDGGAQPRATQHEQGQGRDPADDEAGQRSPPSAAAVPSQPSRAPMSGASRTSPPPDPAAGQQGEQQVDPAHDERADEGAQPPPVGGGDRGDRRAARPATPRSARRARSAAGARRGRSRPGPRSARRRAGRPAAPPSRRGHRPPTSPAPRARPSRARATSCGPGGCSAASSGIR